MEFSIKDCKEFVKKRDENANKGDFGYIGILGGCNKYLGAIKLANLSLTTIRSGAGVVRLIIPKSNIPLISKYILEQTVFPICDNNSYMIFDKEQIDESLKHLRVLLIGVGWGENEDNIKILEYILKNYSLRIVIDADGLNALSKMDLNILKKSKSKIILTPHLKEFSRLTKLSMDEIEKNKEEIAKEFAKEFNIILLLKGHITIVTDGRESYIVKKGGAGMATAGSGDVLSGIIAGMLGSFNPSAKLVASCSYIAGLSGEIAEEKYTDISMKASDTIECIPEAIKKIRTILKQPRENQEGTKRDVPFWLKSKKK